MRKTIVALLVGGLTVFMMTGCSGSVNADEGTGALSAEVSGNGGSTTASNEEVRGSGGSSSSGTLEGELEGEIGGEEVTEDALVEGTDSSESSSYSSGTASKSEHHHHECRHKWVEQYETRVVDEPCMMSREVGCYYRCADCGMEFDTGDEIYQHIINSNGACYSPSEYIPVYEQYPSTFPTVKNILVGYKCSVCGKFKSI